MLGRGCRYPDCQFPPHSNENIYKVNLSLPNSQINPEPVQIASGAAKHTIEWRWVVGCCRMYILQPSTIAGVSFGAYSLQH